MTFHVHISSKDMSFTYPLSTRQFSVEDNFRWTALWYPRKHYCPQGKQLTELHELLSSSRLYSHRPTIITECGGIAYIYISASRWHNERSATVKAEGDGEDCLQFGDM